MSPQRKSKLYYGWVIVIVSFLIITISYGVQYSFGVFLKPLSADFGWTRAQTSSIYSFYIIMHGISAAIMGWLSDRFSSRLTSAIGGILISSGLLLASYAGAIWHLYIFYSFLVGLGVGTSLVPLQATTSRWFTKRRGTALGIVTSGVGAGTLLMPLFASYFVSLYGWRMSYLAMSCVAFLVVVLALLFLKRQPKQPKTGQYNQGIERHQQGLQVQQAILTKSFWFLFACYLFLGIAVTIPITHMVAYATDKGINPVVAATFLSAVGAGGILGRLSLGSLSDKVQAMNLLPFVFVTLAIIIGCFLSADGTILFLLLATLFGFTYGGSAPLLTRVTTKYFGLSSLGAILGCQVLGVAVGGMVGSYFAGYVFDLTNSYQLVFLSGAFSAITALGFLRLLGGQSRTSMECL